MKTSIQVLLIMSMILAQSQTAFADSAGGAAGAILVSFAAAKGAESVAVNALERMELDEWKDERSLTTAVLGDTCGFYYEARVIGDVRYNYLWLTLKNNNSTQRSFSPIEVEFKFSSGIERRPDLFRFNEVFFESSRLYNMILPFPAKEDFKNQQSIDVTVPFYGEGKKCDIPIKLVRNPKVPDTLRGTVSLDALDMEVTYGTSYISGNLGDVIGKNHSVMSFNFLVYGPYGGGLYLGFRSYDQTQISNAVAAQESFPPIWQARASEFYIGYVHRFVLNQDSTAFVRGGIGGMTLSILNEDSTKQDHFSAGTIDLQAGYQRFFNRVKAGIWRGNYYWGASFADSLTSAEKAMKNGTKYDGNAVSAMLTIGVGL
jgi:hypothetical protein